MKLMFKTTLFIYILIFSHNSYSSDGYTCEILEAKSLNEDGKLSLKKHLDAAIGTKFSIDKETGKIIGGGLLLSNSNSSNHPKVIDKGNSQQSFKAITIYEPFAHVAFVQVNEYVKSNNKPFMVVNMVDVFTGICTNL